jgi:dynein heavy chain
MKRLCGGDIQVNVDLKKKISIPDRGSLFDYSFEMKSNKQEGEWVLWLDLIDKNEQYSAKMQPHEILVKTNDTVRYSFLLKLMIDTKNPCLFCGPTGTGKSVYIKNVLQNLPRREFSTIEVGFSAQTTCT